MADESIVIEVKDGVDSSIAVKLRAIGIAARATQKDLDAVQKQLNSIDGRKLTTVTTTAGTASAAINKLAISNENLITAQARATAATASAAAAQDRAAKAAISLAAAQARATAQTQASALAAANAATTAAKMAQAHKGGAAELQKYVMSQKAYNAAMRGVPAQITDIVVSLQGGQRPLTVLLQQGGQLKDMFGGIGNASRALGTALVRMINPVTIAIAAFAAFAYGAYKVESALRELNALSAQFMATGRGDIDNTFIGSLRKELMLLPGVSKTAATAVIQEFANIRDIGSTNLKAASVGVADLATALGVDAPTAAKKLAEALYDPLKGIQDLDKALGLFTVSDFKAVKAMDKAGQTAQAQAFIIAKLRQEYEGLANRSLTPLERASNNLGNAWNKFTDALGNSSVFTAVTDLLAKLLDGLTSVLNAISGWTAPAWFKTVENFYDKMNMFKPANTGGASGSWTEAAKPKGGAFAQTTKYKTDAAGITGKKDNSAENRAAALAKINLQLDNELKLNNMLGPQREKQEMFDRIQEGLLGRKIKLNDAETSSLKEKIAAIVDAKAVQAETNRIYENAIEPLRTYEAASQAANDLLQRGAISEREANKEKLIAFETYANIVDPMREYNKQLDDELKLTKLTSGEKQTESALIQLQNDLLTKGVALRGDEIQGIRERIQENQKAAAAQEAYNTIFEGTIGAYQKIAVETAALTRAQNEGLISSEQYQVRLVALGLAAANIRLASGNGDFADVALTSMGRIVEGYEGMLGGLSKSFGDFFVTLEDGFANSVGRAVVYSENLGDALRSVAQDALSQLISSLVKLGIQYVVNAALGNTLAATSTATGAALASASAAAWAPAAALASLASFGANAAPAMAGIASTVALSSSLASIGKLAGFETGGYTGNGGTSQVAGLVHGKEFVMNAAATNRIGVGNLEALQSGAASLNSNSSTGSGNSVSSGNISVVVENHGTPQTYEQVPTMTPGEYRMIARDEARKVAPDVIASQMKNPNSTVRKSMTANTNVTRK